MQALREVCDTVGIDIPTVVELRVDIPLNMLPISSKGDAPPRFALQAFCASLAMLTRVLITSAHVARNVFESLNGVRTGCNVLEVEELTVWY